MRQDLPRITLIVRALKTLAAHLHEDPNGMTSRGYKHLGTTGGDHVIQDPGGRLYQVDLVTGAVSRCSSIPRITKLKSPRPREIR